MILANFRGTFFWDVLKQGFGIASLPWIELTVWGLILLLALAFSVNRGRMAQYAWTWRRNWPLAGFVAIALLSNLWSVSLSASLYRSGVVLFASLIGAYLGARYGLKELLVILFRFGSILLIICLVLALFVPIAGTMPWEPYNGAWRGVFWHKNQLGSIAAFFSLVFLVGGLDALNRRDGQARLYLAFYILSLVVTFFSKSVAGYLLCIILAGSVALVFVWLTIRDRLRPVHYFAILGIGVLSLALAALNLDLIFGLFNRDTSLTGRLPLWAYLIRDVAGEAPWLGHGFGAIWSSPEFRIQTQERLGWGFPVVIADNGFLDILLHVGVIGLMAFLAVFLLLAVRSARHVLRQPTLVNSFPLLVVVFAVMANVTFSLFLETEAFVWMVMIALLFALTRAEGQQSAFG